MKKYLLCISLFAQVSLLSFAAEEIKKVTLWAPWHEYEIATLVDAGNSVYESTNLLCDPALWGDERYRIRIYREGGSFETYGEPSPGSLDLSLTHNNQWGEGEKNYKVPEEYVGTGKPFVVTVYLNDPDKYTHTITAGDPSGIDEWDMNGYSIYPTVASDRITISSDLENYSVEVVSLAGVPVLRENNASGAINLNVSSLTEGIYIVKVMQNNVVVAIQRVIKL